MTRVIHPRSKTGVSRVVQDGVRDASVSHMMEKVNRGERLMPQGSRQPIFADFTHPMYSSFHEALETVRAVQDHFDSLPSKVRAEFSNDPALLGAALDDPRLEVQERLVQLGVRRKVETPPLASATAPEPPKSEEKAE